MNDGLEDLLLATFQRQLHLVLAYRALEPKHDLFRGLGLQTVRNESHAHSDERTFLWKTGLVWPPYPDCLRS